MAAHVKDAILTENKFIFFKEILNKSLCPFNTNYLDYGDKTPLNLI